MQDRPWQLELGLRAGLLLLLVGLLIRHDYTAVPQVYNTGFCWPDVECTQSLERLELNSDCSRLITLRKRSSILTPVVHLVGYSDSGKTTLMAGLIRIFKTRGYNVAAVKHAAHGYTADPPGTDSWHYAQAGADQVAIVGPESYTLHAYRKTNFPLAKILTELDEADIILVEGFKNSPGAKIEVYRQGISEDRMPWLESRLAVVSDVPIKEENYFSFEELEKIADCIVKSIM